MIEQPGRKKRGDAGGERTGGRGGRVRREALRPGAVVRGRSAGAQAGAAREVVEVGARMRARLPERRVRR